MTSAEASSLILVNPENNKLYFEIALGKKGPEVKKFSLKMGEGIAGWVAKNNRSLIVNDVESDSRFYSDISKKIGFPTNSILAVPMRVKEKCVGVIEILNKKDSKRFNETDLQWLEIFANQAAIAVEHEGRAARLCLDQAGRREGEQRIESAERRHDRACGQQNTGGNEHQAAPDAAEFWFLAQHTTLTVPRPFTL